MATLTYEAIRPVSYFAKDNRPAANHGIIRFNGADETVYQEHYKDQHSFVRDIYDRISKLSDDFAMLNLYASDDTQGNWALNRNELSRLCAKHNVFYTKSRWVPVSNEGYCANWHFIPMDASIFQRVYEWQHVFQYEFYPKKSGNGSWNLDSRYIALLAEQNRCKLLGDPDEGIWVVEPWAKVEEAT